MGINMQQDSKNPKKAVTKMVILILFIAAAIYLVRFSPAKAFLTTRQLGQLLESVGLWAPVMFVFMYAAGVCLFIPGTLLTAMGAAVFGPYLGFMYVWTGPCSAPLSLF